MTAAKAVPVFERKGEQGPDPIKQGMFADREQKNHTWNVYATDMKFEDDLCHPARWTAAPKQVRTGDKLCVYSNEFYAEALVHLFIPHGTCVLIPLLKVRRPDLTVESRSARLPQNHRVYYGGELDGWIAERTGDKPAILSKGLRSEEESIRFILDHATLRK